MSKKTLESFKDILKSYWLFFLPHHLFSRFTYIITRTKHPLTKYLINLYISLFKKINFTVQDESAWSVGLACGGEMTVFIEQIN